MTPEGTPVDATVVRVGPFNATHRRRVPRTICRARSSSRSCRGSPAREFTIAGGARCEDATEGYVERVVDPTRGVLLSIYAQRPNVMERIEKGEAVGYIIILVGVVGAVLAHLPAVLPRARCAARCATSSSSRTRRSRQSAGPRARHVQRRSRARCEERTREVVELRISEAVLKEVPKLERFQSFLRLAVAAGPLLGLIGTVVGMILTFQSITESGSSDPKLMANGISQAMIATVLGLGIAMPLLFANAWLASISKSIVQILDEQSTGLLAERLEGKTDVLDALLAPFDAVARRCASWVAPVVDWIFVACVLMWADRDRALLVLLARSCRSRSRRVAAGVAARARIARAGARSRSARR